VRPCLKKKGREEGRREGKLAKKKKIRLVFREREKN
jgi:hypothetical protein